MPERNGEGPAPQLLGHLGAFITPGLPLEQATETWLLLEVLVASENGEAFWHASALRPLAWLHGVAQVGIN